ncbi:prephenate/arogenate dehydrogenase [Prochlorococcus marinus]|uniref:prephenate/arogenate dehydrogenase n=1 Tax=Prochlorococcus marinus TaxID=1219 RepID=UPI0022B57D2F|nr:prephenate/arogenate dehydrogenase [Prochlorococcus marinus]
MGLERVGIVGLGLIGGSIGLDLQKLGYEVYGLVNRSQTLEQAKKRNLAQFISLDPQIISNCSLIILALPLSQLIKPTTDLIHALPPNAVITDVGSVKTPVITTWKELHPKFIGSHPMAGTTDSGVNAGKKNLFQNRPWIATPDRTTDPEALEVVYKLALALGSNWITADAQLHDQAVALISHLPVFISAALLKAVNRQEDTALLELTKSIASSGFADTTRVGGGNPELGLAMAETNTASLLEALHTYNSSITELTAMIHSKQWEALYKELKSTQLNRPDFISN